MHAGGQRFDPARLHHISPVMMAKRPHPFPFRTRKLSSSAPMVVGAHAPVRVGHCRAQRDQFSNELVFLFYLLDVIKNEPVQPNIFIMHITWRVCSKAPNRGMNNCSVL